MRWRRQAARLGSTIGLKARWTCRDAEVDKRGDMPCGAVAWRRLPRGAAGLEHGKLKSARSRELQIVFWVAPYTYDYFYPSGCGHGNHSRGIIGPHLEQLNQYLLYERKKDQARKLEESCTEQFIKIIVQDVLFLFLVSYHLIPI